MPIRLFELSGRAIDLDELERSAPAYKCAVRRYDGGIYLGSSDFDASGSYSQARTLAAERVQVLNALARLRNHLFKPLTLGSGLTVDDEGGRSMTVHPAPAVGAAMVSLDANIADGASPPSPRRSFEERAIELAQRNPEFMRALTTYQTRPVDPSLLYHVAEILADDLDLNRLTRYGVDPAEIEKFKSVHDHAVFGPAARHGHRGVRPPRIQVSLEDAHSFLGEVFRKVVDHEVRN